MQIELTLKNYRVFADSHPARFILEPGFTAFIGLNNSGKTTLLRFIYEFRQIFQELMQQSGVVTTLLRTDVEQFSSTSVIGVTDREEVFNNRNDRDITVELRVSPTTDDEIDDRGPVPERVTLTFVRTTGQYFLRAEPAVQPGDLTWLGPGLIGIGSTPILSWSLYQRAFELLASAIYIGAFRNTITEGGLSYYDLQIGRNFIAAWDQFKAGTQRSQSRAALQVTKDIQEIFGFDSLELNATQDGNNLQVVIDGDIHLLHELGAGISHFILVLAFIAVRQAPTPLILMDEPESNLHPSLQLAFLRAVGARAEFGVAFATHSVGLARAAAERTYVVDLIRRGESDVRDLEGSPRFAELLGELSFDGYREVGFDAVLLVEGPTDVKVVRELLRLYGDERRALVMPLGGRSMIHGGVAEQLAELTRISSNIWALVDSERGEERDAIPNDIERFRDECADVGITCHVLERRAIENYLPDRAVREFFGDSSRRGLQPFERRDDLPKPWAKTANWRIAREIRADELGGTDLAEFLEAFAASMS